MRNFYYVLLLFITKLYLMSAYLWSIHQSCARIYLENKLLSWYKWHFNKIFKLVKKRIYPKFLFDSGSHWCFVLLFDQIIFLKSLNTHINTLALAFASIQKLLCFTALKNWIIILLSGTPNICIGIAKLQICQTPKSSHPLKNLEGSIFG